MNALLSQTRELLDILGHEEEPIGMFYSEEKPDGPGPKPGPILSAEAEAQGELDMQSVWGGFSCLMGRVLLARKKKIATWIAAEAYGCAGAAFYAGFYKPQLEAVTRFISTGTPGFMEGEWFLPSVETCRAFFEKVDPQPAPKPYCVFKPLSLFTEDEEPEVITFFLGGEMLSVFCNLLSFTTGDPESNLAPFGAGCTAITAWPLHYKAKNLDRAVIGGMDLAARSFYNIGELSWSLPTELYRRLLFAAPNSFLKTKEWEKFRKRLDKV